MENNLRIDYALRLPTRYGEFKMHYLEFIEGAHEVGIHKHNDFEIIYVMAGALKLKVEQTLFILYENQFIFLEPDVFHEFWCAAGTDFSILQFGDFVADNIHQKMDWDDSLFIRLNSMIASHKIIYDTKDGKTLLESSKKELLKKEWGYKLVIGNYIANFLYLCLRNLPDKEFEGADLIEAPLEFNLPNQVLNYMRAHLTENLKIETVAQHFFMSSRHINRLLGQYYGISFKQLLQHLRFIEAERLMKDPSLSLEEITEAIGYTSLRSLYDLFEKEKHTTPAKYRQLLLDHITE